MLRLIILLFVLAIVAAIFGWGGFASGLASIAQVLFFVFLALFIISFAVRALRGESVA